MSPRDVSRRIDILGIVVGMVDEVELRCDHDYSETEAVDSKHLNS